MPSLELVPPSSAHVQTFRLESSDRFPNGASGLPVVLYRPFAPPAFDAAGALDPAAVEALVAAHGFAPGWRFPMYDFAHFHSTTHELLVPFRGRATLELGDAGAGATQLDVRAGDVLLLPAGTAHRAARTADAFCMVGSYPAGAARWDMCRGGGSGAEARIRALGKGGVAEDPVYGGRGVVGEAWGL
jgi:uncharacterized protein YjlB